MMFDSRETLIKAIKAIRKTEPQAVQQWSDPIYPCPKCGGNMRMNMYGGRVLTSLPPIHQHEYQCDKCGFTEYI